MRTPRSKILSLREEKELTQEVLSHWLGMSLAGYRRWEKKPSVAHNIVKLILLCRLFSCGPRDLLVNNKSLNTKVCSGANLDLEQIHQGFRRRSDDSIFETRIPEFLTELRRSKGITQAQIQSALDVSESTIQNWERGRSRPPLLGNCIILCDVFGCCIEDLVDYIPEEQAAKVENLLHMTIREEPPSQKDISQIKSDFKKSLSESSCLANEVSRQKEMEVIE